MNNQFKAFSIALLVGTMSACSSTPDKDEIKISDRSPIAIYKDAREAMELGNYSKGIRTLEALESRYPFGPHKEQVKLDLIYAYYKLDDAASAIAKIDAFMDNNPSHPDLDYAQYMRGLVNMQADRYMFHDMFGVDRTDRDPENSNQAFKDFEILIKNYPNSEYVHDAKQRMVHLRNRLADYSLRVARYYLEMDAHAAAANRAQLVLEKFSQSPARKEALEIMLECYEALGQQQLAEHIKQVIALNHAN
ncbi:outer membrane protein assembly factor BamD [Paraferrimonas sp. SM1919]|uniref:outer membrane protein assembly factor BamD n=1 Tax=Paraferrimonas sp. SM1919 TaxID=2662263 RepID=UPI0013D49201|nr:outer membrane protein assembly factor BamD [Paraferrimonas sp. SM1919]